MQGRKKFNCPSPHSSFTSHSHLLLFSVNAGSFSLHERFPCCDPVALKEGGKGSLMFNLPARGPPRTFTERVLQS